MVLHGIVIRARLCYHIGGNPSVHNRGQPGVKPRSDYNLITTFTFTIAPRWQHQWEFSFGIWDIEKFEHESVLLTIFAPFLTTPHYEVINNTCLLFINSFQLASKNLLTPQPCLVSWKDVFFSKYPRHLYQIYIKIFIKPFCRLNDALFAYKCSVWEMNLYKMQQHCWSEVFLNSENSEKKQRSRKQTMEK